MTRMSTEKAQKSLGAVVEQVSEKGARYILTRKGRNVAAIISWNDFQKLEKIRRHLEDQADIKACDKAIDEPGEDIPYGWLRRELGIV